VSPQHIRNTATINVDGGCNNILYFGGKEGLEPFMDGFNKIIQQCQDLNDGRLKITLETQCTLY